MFTSLRSSLRLQSASLHSPSLTSKSTARIHWRLFRSSACRKDVFFVSIPVAKSFLLDITRISLVALPFFYRYRLMRRFKKTSRFLLQIPIACFAFIIAIGINQSPETARWRLLLMSEREEIAWSAARFEKIIKEVKDQILPSSDERVQIAKRVCDKLITSLSTNQESIVSCARWPRDQEDLMKATKQLEARLQIQPSARTECTAFLPWRPPSSNPEKRFMDTNSWDLFVLDSPSIQAFVLPTREIFVHTGMIEFLNNDEAQLAAILAHEICHVTERHSVENMGFLALSSVIFDILRGVTFALTLSFPYVGDTMSSAFTFLNNTVADRAYNRKLESEADMLGLNVSSSSLAPSTSQLSFIKLMAQSHYDPRNAITLWRSLNKTEEENGGDQTLPLLRTHPTGERRLRDLEAALPKAMEIYQDCRAKH